MHHDLRSRSPIHPTKSRRDQSSDSPLLSSSIKMPSRIKEVECRPWVAVLLAVRVDRSVRHAQWMKGMPLRPQR